MRSAPAWLAVTHWSLDAIRLADAMDAVNLLAGLTAGYHAGLHLGLCEVLEFIVDVQVLDTTVEAGTVLDLPEAESACVHVHRHSCRKTDRIMLMGVKPNKVDHKHNHQRADMGVMAEHIQMCVCPTVHCKIPLIFKKIFFESAPEDTSLKQGTTEEKEEDDIRRVTHNTALHSDTFLHFFLVIINSLDTTDNSYEQIHSQQAQPHPQT